MNETTDVWAEGLQRCTQAMAAFGESLSAMVRYIKRTVETWTAAAGRCGRRTWRGHRRCGRVFCEHDDDAGRYCLLTDRPSA